MSNTPPQTKKSVPLSLFGKTCSVIFNLLLLALLAWMLLLLFATLSVLCWGWQIVWEVFEKAILGMTSHLWVTQLGLGQIIHQANVRHPLPDSLSWAFPADAVPLASFIHKASHAWVVILLVTQFVVQRCQVFLMGCAVIVVFSLLGFIDGLVQRDIRKFQNARESTLFFHRSKSTLSTLFFMGYFLFIAIPLDINLSICLTVIAFVTGYIIQVTTRQFKKHL